MKHDFNIHEHLHSERMSIEEHKRAEFWVQANSLVRKSGRHNFERTRIVVNEKWDFNYLNEELEDYEDNKIIEFFRYGWPLNAKNVQLQDHIPRNQKGARSNTEELRRYINKQRAAGTVIGPFKSSPFGDVTRISPLDTRPKKDTEELRIILNLSYPVKGGSVNDGIDKKFFMEEKIELSYPTTDDLAKIVVKKGRGCKIFKRDLSQAYKQFFYCPGDIHLLGFIIEDEIYFDITLCMGAASSALYCQHSTNAVTFIFKKKGYDDVNYLDDLGGAEITEKAQEAFNMLAEILQKIGIRESASKACAPSSVAVFLGILFNTEEMYMKITEDRMKEIKNILKTWMKKEEATLKEIQSLLGKLNFAASTVRAGRIFVSRIITALKQMNNEGSQPVPEWMKKDIQWWSIYMAQFDGKNLIPSFSWSAPGKTFTTDACLSGCGGWTDDACFHTQFPSFILDNNNIHINELETLAIIIGLKLWKNKIRDKNVLVHCDNKTTVDIVNTGRASNEFAQSCLREICFITANVNAVVKVRFKPGVQNTEADFLSRYHTSEIFRNQAVEEIQKRKWRDTFVYEGLFRFLHEW